jgi:hypothetical protein
MIYRTLGVPNPYFGADGGRSDDDLMTDEEVNSHLVY